MFNRKHDQKEPVPFQLRRPEDAGQHQPPQIPSENYQSASMIGSDLSIEGQGITIRCQGLLTVNGDISADVHAKHLDVGREGSIVGAVAAENVEVHGKVQGAIHGARVVLYPSAEVDGDIHTQFLTIQEGASFDGRSRKVRDVAEVAPKLTRGSSQPAQVTHQKSAQASEAPAPQFGTGHRPLN